MLPTKPNKPTPIYDALLATDRIQALTNCDPNLISYNQKSFLLVFRFRGRNLKMILLPLAALLLWDLFWGIFLITYEDPLDILEPLQRMDTKISPILTPVSFLLVFRLGRAGVRFWDARAALGKMVEVCRTMGSTALSGLIHKKNQHQPLADDFVRWIAVLPIAVKNFLRPWEGLKCNRSMEIGDVLSAQDKLEFLASEGTLYAPILVLNRLRQLSFQAAHELSSNGDASTTMSGVFLRQLNEQIDILTGAWGAMERINSTPLPFVYVVHLRTFLLLYLFLWHIEAIATSGWAALLPLQLASWGLLGIEAAAVECERPFQWNSNHLALGKSGIVVAQNLAQTYSNLGWVVQVGEEGPKSLDC